MKPYRNWSYAPYRPFFPDFGEIYICQVIPAENAVTFCWLPIDAAEYQIFYRVRSCEDFLTAGTTNQCRFTIDNLTTGTEYEFFVRGGNYHSSVRLARCGSAVDTVVNYLHPQDNGYAFSGRFLCSPSLVRHPDGFLLASMDVFSHTAPQNLTLIFRSDDEGATWHYVSELCPCFWGKLFVHRGQLYMLACSTEYGDLLIGKSADGGKTFSEPVVLLRGSNGKQEYPGVHRAPQPFVEYGSRIWTSVEWGSWKAGFFAAMVLSAPVDADLMNPDSWSFSQPVCRESNVSGVPQITIEGCLLPLPEGLYNVMRYDMRKMEPNYGLALAYAVNTEDPEAPLRYHHFIPFPANHSKFQMQYCPATGKYYSIASRILGPEHANDRNLLSLLVSDDAYNWSVERDLIDMRKKDPKEVGFQYVDFIIEGREILYLCRTAVNGADNYHNSNYITFGRISL